MRSKYFAPEELACQRLLDAIRERGDGAVQFVYIDTRGVAA